MLESQKSIASTEAITAPISNKIESLTAALPLAIKTGGMFTVENQVSQITTKISSDIADCVTNSPTKGDKITSPLILNCEQAVQQLKLLGYEEGEKIYIRGFFPNDDPKGRKGGKNELATNSKQLAHKIQRLQREGRGAYFVVNGDGQKDIDVKQCRAIFYEHDDLDKAQQIELWKLLGLPEPTFQVDSGGKSIHSYWVFDEFVSPELWKPLQADLLEFADGDRSIKNPSRVMRLAGGWHLSQKGAVQSRIISNSGKKYSFDDLRKIVPPQEKEQVPVPLSKPSPMSLTSMTAEVPLVQYLRKLDRLFINGVGFGIRNTTGAMLARNLIGTAKRLSELGEAFSGDPRQLFDDYCSRCSPTIDPPEAEEIWASASKSNPTPTLSDDVLRNCGAAWRRRAQQVNFTAPTTNKVTQLSPKAISISIEERVKEILERGMGKKSEKSSLLELAQQTGIPLKDIEAIALLQREEDEADECRDERKQHISEFLKAEHKSLDLSNFFPKELADPLKKWCGCLNIPESVALTAILTTTSTLHPVGTELIIQRDLDFSVPPILYSAIIGESGQKKSPVYRTLIKKPLRVLQNETKEVYHQQLKQYECDLADWQKNKEGPKLTKPSLPIYYFTDATGEGIKAQAQECPEKAMFALIDELAGLFNSANQYRGGKGSDKQDMLSYYDGFGQTVLRSSGIKVDVDRIYLSVFGGIQPSVLRDHLKDLKDADGQWARFLFIHQPLAISTLPDEDSGIDLKELLSGCYRRVSLVPQTQYVLSKAAFEAYNPIYDELEKKRVSDPEPGMRAVYSKMEGGIGRLALNLHVLSSAFSGLPPEKEIPLEIMQKAIALADFYIKEIKSIHIDSKADRGELTAIQTKLLEYAIAKGSLTPRDAVTKFNAIKSSPVALEFFRELQAMGYGTVDKQKRNWIFIPSEISRNEIEISRNGLKNLPNNDCSDSRNEIEISRNGSRNGLVGEQSLPNNNSSDSRNERNGCNDSEDFSQNTACKKPTNSSDDFEKSTDSITPLRSLRETPQNETGTETQPRNGSRNGQSEIITRTDQEIKVGASVASADPNSPSYHWRAQSC